MITFFKESNAACDGLCHGSKITCVGIDTFKSCELNDSSPVFKCTRGFVCSADSPEWCIDPSKPGYNTIDCKDICRGVCPANPELGSYKCIGPNQYRLCTKVGIFDKICPDNQVCTLDNKCADPSRSEPLCPYLI